MSVDNDTTFGDGLEEVTPGEPTVIIQIKEFECLEQESIETHLR